MEIITNKHTDTFSGLSQGGKRLNHGDTLSEEHVVSPNTQWGWRWLTHTDSTVPLINGRVNCPDEPVNCLMLKRINHLLEMVLSESCDDSSYG